MKRNVLFRALYLFPCPAILVIPSYLRESYIPRLRNSYFPTRLPSSDIRSEEQLFHLARYAVCLPSQQIDPMRLGDEGILPYEALVFGKVEADKESC